MPRQARLDIPGALHHIMVRGINRTDIFEDERDKLKFLDRLGAMVTAGQCSVYAWVLMSNHVHVLFKSGRDGISSVMRKLLTWYAQYYNRRHRRTGHLFENRYKSILCDEDTYLLALVRYIHLNPIRAGLVKTMEVLDRYPWSGHRTIIGRTKHIWMDTEYVLAQFGDTRRKALREYRNFMGEGAGEGYIKELTGGGLIRSQGGWSQVLAMRRRGRKEEFDERILGGGVFVENILKEVEDRQLRQLKAKRSGKNIQKIIEEECQRLGISTIELQSGSKRRKVSNARAAIGLRSREELGLSAAEIARSVGVNTSAISRAIERMERHGGHKWHK
jgi:REP element-mobilizing transposase RayT/DNA-binding transcriptional regulator YhcF (GntR family)